MLQVPRGGSYLKVTTLKRHGASAICVLPGVVNAATGSAGAVRLCGSPVDIEYLADTADCLISYGAETTVAVFLSRGVPQLLIPDLLEGLLTSYRVFNQGAGKILHPSATDDAIELALGEILTSQTFHQGARHMSDAIAVMKLPNAFNRLGDSIEDRR